MTDTHRKEIRNLVNLAYFFGIGAVDYLESEPTPTIEQVGHWHNSHVDEVTDKIIALVSSLENKGEA